MTVERMIELLEIEKECVLRNAIGECNRYCAGCDLLQDDTELHEMYTEALTLLKAQEPRVMTLDELSEKTDVWFESLVYDTIDPALSSGSYDDGTVGLMTLEEELFYLDEADYGTKWRCWTQRPTDAQREAVPWE